MLLEVCGGCERIKTTLIAYFVMAGEGIAHYVEEPFGTHEDHLDLEQICQGIEQSVSEVLIGEA